MAVWFIWVLKAGYGFTWNTYRLLIKLLEQSNLERLPLGVSQAARGMTVQLLCLKRSAREQRHKEKP